MKKNATTYATLVLAAAILDSILNEANRQIKKETTTPPTTSIDDYPLLCGVSREAFGEEELVSFLVDEVGLEVKSTSADYPPTAKLMAMSTDEVKQIKDYCDSLKKKAEFGDKVMKSVEMLKGLFK